MFSSAWWHDSQCRGAALIGAGLACVVVAQFTSSVAAAIALIGWGALQTVRTESLALANFLVYGVLVSFTIASQTHAAQNSASGQLSLLTTADHVAAVLLLAGLTWYALRRALHPSDDGC
jgi:hypothetical protein